MQYNKLQLHRLLIILTPPKALVRESGSRRAVNPFQIRALEDENTLDTLTALSTPDLCPAYSSNANPPTPAMPSSLPIIPYPLTTSIFRLCQPTALPTFPFASANDLNQLLRGCSAGK